MRKAMGAILAIGVCAVAGCGNDEKPTTIVKTVAPPSPAPPADGATATTEPGETVDAPTAPPGTPTQAPPPGPPLPDGVAAVQGRYRMEYLDYSPSGYTLGGTYTGNEEQWNAETSCTGQSCTVNLRRALQSGGFKNYKLTSSAPKKYAGTFSAEADICEADPAITVKERVSIQTSRVADLGGTPTVTGLDV